jgi:hypothetical protein
VPIVTRLIKSTFSCSLATGELISDSHATKGERISGAIGSILSAMRTILRVISITPMSTGISGERS